jgi:uncharacterized membrane protein
MTIEDIIKEVFKKSWKIFSNKFVVLIVGTLIAILLMLFIITIPPLIFGIYYMCIQLMNGKEVKISDVFKGFHWFFRSWGLLILMALGILGGLILLIVPGILLMIVWQYAFAISIIEDKGVIESLRRSYHIGKNNFAFSIVFWILLMIISSVGSITRIGVLVTLPFTVLATCVATRILSKKVKDSSKNEK